MDAQSPAEAARRRPYVKRQPYVRGPKPNPLRAWLELNLMTKMEFAEKIGVTSSYVTQLCADNGPWPSRRVSRRIAIVTKGKVTADDLARWRP